MGYLLSGPLSADPRRRDETNAHQLNVITAPPDVMDLQRYWKLESLGISESKSDNSTSLVMEDDTNTTVTFDDEL